MSDAADDRDLIQTALLRRRRVAESEQVNRQEAMEDLRFKVGNQWPTEVQKIRDRRPMLTLNQCPQFIKQVANEQRMNSPAIKVVPADSDASEDVAEIMTGLVRHIQYDSNADAVFDTAFENMVSMGWGYWRILTEYEKETSFDQKIVIRRIVNPFSVYYDPDCIEADGSDARFCFISESITRDEFKRRWPKANAIGLSQEALGEFSEDWIDGDNLYIADYYYKEKVNKTLVRMASGSQAVNVFEDDPKMEFLAAQGFFPQARREVETEKVCWVKISGGEVLERFDWLGKDIPVVREVGEETLVDGKIVRSGLIRHARDPQRMVNYMYTNAVELLALQPRAPYVGYAGQFKGFESRWQNANTVNYPYLEVNPEMINGQLAPLPQRQPAPQLSAGHVELLNISSAMMKSTIGMYDPMLGQRSNETSGVAIQRRKSQGETGTFNYIDNHTRALKYTGRILLDLIPKYYDAPRLIQWMGENGDHELHEVNQPTMQADPTTGQAMQVIMNNLAAGKYDMVVTTGPSYATKRQEATQSMMDFLQYNPNAAPLIGDLIAKNQDWPGADEIADRLQAMLPPQVKQLEGQDNPQLFQMQQQFQQQMQQMQQAAEAQLKQAGQTIQTLQMQLQAAKLDNTAKQEKNQVDLLLGKIDAILELMKLQQTQVMPVGAEAQALEAPVGNIMRPGAFSGN
jgi:hypothetical protein